MLLVLLVSLIDVMMIWHAARVVGLVDRCYDDIGTLLVLLVSLVYVNDNIGMLLVLLVSLIDVMIILARCSCCWSR